MPAMLALAFAALLAASPPGGGDELLRVDWAVPSECPDEAELRRRVETLIDPALERDAVEARVAIVRIDARRLALHMQVTTERGTLTPSGDADNCDTLVDAAALQIALASDPRSFGPSSEPARPPPPPPPSEDEPSRDEGDANRSRRVSGRLGVGGGVGLGVLPDVDGWLVATSAVVVTPRWRWAARVRGEALLGHVLSRAEPVPSGAPGAAVRVSAWWLALRGCLEPSLTRAPDPIVRAPLCLGPELAAVVGRGEGVARSLTATRPWWALGGSAAIVIRLMERLDARVGAESFVTIIAPSFTVDDGDPVYAAQRFGVRGLVTLEARLP